MAPAKPPDADPTMTASEVAMKRALPRPQPARNPTIPPMLPLAPASAEDSSTAPHQPARGRERWVINKLRALMAWYSKGVENGSHLRGRINTCNSLGELREIIDEFFAPAVSLAS